MCRVTVCLKFPLKFVELPNQLFSVSAMAQLKVNCGLVKFLLTIVLFHNFSGCIIEKLGTSKCATVHWSGLQRPNSQPYCRYTRIVRLELC